MKRLPLLVLLPALLLTAVPPAGAADAGPSADPVSPKPLYRDPVFDGAADPIVVWNAQHNAWWMLYTNRRANAPGLSGTAWVHGCRIGIAESADGAAPWRYVGTCDIELPPGIGGAEPTHWAPDVVTAPDGTHHLFLTVVPGVFEDWNHPRAIVHLTSTDLRRWSHGAALKLASDRAIDACVKRLPDGTWRMWYNNERDGKAIYFADSPDLDTWTDRGRCAGVAGRCEGPFVFTWKGRHWMLVDTWKGLGAYRSDDLLTWTAQKEVLLAQPGRGADDGVNGGHAGVVVDGDRAFCFYFTHPGRAGTISQKDKNSTETRRSSIQVVELREQDGLLTCDRDAPTRLRLRPPAAAQPAGVSSRARAVAATAAAGAKAASAGSRAAREARPAFDLDAAVGDLLAALDLKRPGLEAVAAAQDRKDRPAARAALAAYLRQRTKPLFIDPADAAAKAALYSDDRGTAERAIRHELTSIGIPHAFGPHIDWNFDKTTEPGTKLAQNGEWTWQLNRHAGWAALARAYRATGDEKYAREFVAQITAWVRDCPRPATSGNVSRSAWRTIETGIRAASVWPSLWAAFLKSPAMTDDALLTFLHAYREHALHLMAYHTTGNWLAMEGNGLFHVGVLFPEFRDAPAWRDTAAGWIHAELNNQVYPDGVQIELASGYHHVSLGNFLGVFKIARLNGVALPADFLARLEKMYDFDVWGATPSRSLPGVQDSARYDVRKALAEAATLYPQRADFQWYATEGKKGAPPATTSHAFPWAGYFVMRSGWDRDARWLLFDGGPFGYGHQHEDKLQIIVEAYGSSFLVDPGNFTYERSKWRSYFVDSPAHNVVLVDGQPQRRRGNKDRTAYIVKAPLPHVWASDASSDYAEATYDEGFGGKVGRGVAHTRAVLFVKPDFWVVLDRLAAVDGKEHDYETLFHFDGPVRTDGTRLVTRNPEAANLTILPRPEAGLTVATVEGREEPVQGWLPIGSSRVRPAPVAIYTARGATRHFLYVLAPAPKGAADPVRSVEPLDGDPLAARITFADGRKYEVRFTPGRPASWRKLP